MISWILNSLSKETPLVFSFRTRAREIWLDLKERFQRQNRPCIFQLSRDLSYLAQDQLYVSTYFTRLKPLWIELVSYHPVCSCGGVRSLKDHYQQEYVMAFFMGLNDSFSQIRAQLLLMEPTSMINRAFALVAQDMQQHALVLPSNASPAALMVRDQSTNSSSSPNHRRRRRRLYTLIV